MGAQKLKKRQLVQLSPIGRQNLLVNLQIWHQEFINL
jgi:hypothetical protein